MSAPEDSLRIGPFVRKEERSLLDGFDLNLVAQPTDFASCSRRFTLRLIATDSITSHDGVFWHMSVVRNTPE